MKTKGRPSDASWEAVTQRIPIFVGPPHLVTSPEAADGRREDRKKKTKPGSSHSSYAAFDLTEADDDDDIEIFDPDKKTREEKARKKGPAKPQAASLNQQRLPYTDAVVDDDDDENIEIFDPSGRRNGGGGRGNGGHRPGGLLEENSSGRMRSSNIQISSTGASHRSNNIGTNSTSQLNDDSALAAGTDDDDSVAVFNPANSSQFAKDGEGGGDDDDESVEIFDPSANGGGEGTDSKGGGAGKADAGDRKHGGGKKRGSVAMAEVFVLGDAEDDEDMMSMGEGSDSGQSIYLLPDNEEEVVDNVDVKENEDENSGRHQAFNREEILSMIETIKTHVKAIDKTVHRVFNFLPVCRTYLHWRNLLLRIWNECEDNGKGKGPTTISSISAYRFSIYNPFKQKQLIKSHHR